MGAGAPDLKRRGSGKRRDGDVVYDERDRQIERQALLFSLPLEQVFQYDGG